MYAAIMHRLVRMQEPSMSLDSKVLYQSHWTASLFTKAQMPKHVVDRDTFSSISLYAWCGPASTPRMLPQADCG